VERAQEKKKNSIYVQECPDTGKRKKMGAQSARNAEKGKKRKEELLAFGRLIQTVQEKKGKSWGERPVPSESPRKRGGRGGGGKGLCWILVTICKV